MSDNKGSSSWTKVMPFKNTKKKTPQPPSQSPPEIKKPISQFLHENTDTIVWVKPSSPKRTTVRRQTAANATAVSNASQYHNKIERVVNGDAPLKKNLYPEDFRKKLLKSRLDAGLTQELFAKKFNVKTAVIKAIENSTAVYDPIIMQKLSNLLNKMT